MSVPNQNIVRINKRKSKRFLQVNIDSWQEAYQRLSPAAFGMYLYFASNANGYELEVSKTAIENAIGIKKTSYYRGFQELIDKGYLVQDKKQKNHYNFFPNFRNQNSSNEENDNTSKNQIPKNRNQNSQRQEKVVPKMGIEIYKEHINITDKKTEPEEEDFKAQWYNQE